MNQTLDVRLYCHLRFSTQHLFSCQTATVFDAFAQAQSAGDAEAERILDHLQLRYFSPSELLRLFYFDASLEDSHISHLQLEQPFLWPGDISTKTKYRLIGNSVNVKVVTALIDFLFDEGSSA
jgi:tRNA (cytosine38-C5)-methyltransferase